MSVSPLIEETNLITFTILSNGVEIRDSYEVLSLRTEQLVNRIASAEIILADGNAPKQSFPISDSETFKPGAEIEIKLGYHSKNELVFKGVVIKQLIKIASSERTTLQVICKDKALKMTTNRVNAIFTNETDSSIIKKLAEKSELISDISSTTSEHKEVVQFYASDWDFIVTRAEVNSMIVLTENGKLIVAKPNVSSEPELEVTFGHDIIEFDGEMDATYQFSEVKSTAWDSANQKVIEATASESEVNKQGNISGKSLAEVLSTGANNLNSSTGITSEDIQTWANAALLKSRLSRFKGSITFQGSTKAKANSLLKLKGVGKRFEGNAFISGVVHILDEGTWHTEAKIGLDPEWFAETHQVAAPLASGLLPGVKGLQTGIVKKTFEDPENQFRVQVEIPILGAEGESVWARLSTFYSGNGIGAYFMPELGDEVLLGFMNDDPRFPIILGSVYSTAIPAPETPDEENTIKTLITKSKLQLKFDDEKKIITLLTPNGNTMVFSDEDEAITITDQNKNKIEMNSSGISLESPTSINIKATEEVNIQGAKISIKGDESLSASSLEVTISGETSTSISGSAECSISSDGNLSAKGLMVMIN